MAKKTFKGGLDSLLSSSNFDNQQSQEGKENQNENLPEKELSKEEQHWLLIKIKRYEKELKLWRTGELTPEKFKNSLKDHGLSYNADSNEIE